METVLEKIVNGMRYLPEIVLFMPFDFLTIDIRDVCIPRFIKEWCPYLSCRRYPIYGVKCGPAIKYHHKELFRTMCKYYDLKSGNCRKYKK